uniref:Lipocalin/cytosolic fatty-acid binding domain-containing protein n=1 Tax=Chromera velia CCMP2878 TaxID=1169474 RepID=A0A0G4HR18_9ALVE|eukprot:Cvel_30462.t1-p1 / transcript=Cvel_30462.t1 / gene=Cvel_30462 / organism=Chromera_velia_CCMP2878 / gene_product=hypothetical protein / transcript_product=hypothetical protein / location=Cvel_scaffold4345:3261-4844(-) / protein_length=215 / sequence_SO=supercontig / SO=protein_coding / is_pseudo=false
MDSGLRTAVFSRCFSFWLLLCSIFPANLTDDTGLWYQVDTPAGRSRVAVVVGLCVASALGDEATVELRVCREVHDRPCQTVAKKDVSKQLAESYPALYAPGCSEAEELKTVLYEGDHLIVGISTKYWNRGDYTLTARDAEIEGSCTEDTRFTDDDGDGCDVYAAYSDFCDGAEQLVAASSSSFAGRSTRDSCCACTGKPAPSRGNPQRVKRLPCI